MAELKQEHEKQLSSDSFIMTSSCATLEQEHPRITECPWKQSHINLYVTKISTLKTRNFSQKTNVLYIKNINLLLSEIADFNSISMFDVNKLHKCSQTLLPNVPLPITSASFSFSFNTHVSLHLYNLELIREWIHIDYLNTAAI